MIRQLTLYSLALALLPGPLFCAPVHQNQAPAPVQHPFEAHAHEVTLPVAVLTPSGKPLENLNAADFQLLDNGKAQIVHVLTHDALNLPIYVVLVLQSSGLSDPALAKIKKTASVVTSYISNDMEIGAPSLTALVTASDDVRVRQTFTPDAAKLDDAFYRLRADGDAGHVLDAVDTACDLLTSRGEPARRMIVVIAESRDRGSKTHVQDVIAKAQKASITIYTLSYSAYSTAFTQKASEIQPADQPGEYDPHGGSGGGGIPLLALGMELARLAKVNMAVALSSGTGGQHTSFTKLKTLEDRLAAIGADIHSRYLLTFVPDDSVAGYHTLSLHLNNHPAAVLRYRPGYWAVP